jgi:HSP20 family protein
MTKKEKRVEIVPGGHYFGPEWMSDFDRFFEDFDRGWMRPYFRFHELRGPEGTRMPRVNVKDEGEDIVVTAEMPGVRKEDLDISIHENVLELKSETKQEVEEKDDETGYFRREMRQSSFYRQVPLPEDVVPEESQAELKDGILTVSVKKATVGEMKKHTIKVK